MSKLGKKPITIPADITVKTKEKKIYIEGKKGRREEELPSDVSTEVKDNKIFVMYHGKREEKALWGTWYSRIKNMVEGVTQGFEKKLKIVGVGWRANLEGSDLVLKTGFTHPVKVSSSEGITFSVEKDLIIVSGINKEKVGSIAAKIRRIKPPEPYKGKGIRYIDEVVRRKAGKKAVTAVK